MILTNDVLIEISGKCNLYCKHCYLPHNNDFVDIKYNFRELLDCLAGNDVLKIIFTGYEPLLNPNIFEYIGMARDSRFLVSLKTNGYSFSSEVVKRLKELNIYKVIVSLYSSIAEDHDNITKVKGSFEKVMDTVQLCKKNGIKVKVTSPLIHPMPDLNELLLLYRKMDVDWLFDSNIISSFNHREEVEKSKLTSLEIEKYLKFMLDNDLMDPIDITGEKKYHICRIGESITYIDINGGCHLCSSFSDSVAHFTEFNTKDYFKYNQSFIGQIEQNSQCINCELLKFCQPCPALSLSENGNLFECSSTQKKYAEALRKVTMETSNF